MNHYFSLSDKLFDLTEQFPETIEVLAQLGFEAVKNDAMRKTLGKAISLEMALKSKGLDVAQTEEALCAAIEQARPSEDALRVEGVLPCPIRIQITERLDQWIREHDIPVNASLQAASMGLDHIEERVRNAKSVDDLADLYLSAGFGLFFDRKLLGGYCDAGTFADMTGIDHMNSFFENDKIKLKDPRNQYSILGVVPAVFMVNESLLGDRPCPRSWKDLFAPEFANSVALPVRDLDLFNALLLGLYQAYGEEGVKAMGRSLLQSMHPAQMVKTGKKTLGNAPVVTVMPYFFTLMAGEDSKLTPIWPEDGAVISPIFLLAKASAAEKARPFAQFLGSKEMGQVFAEGGKFPSTHPEVDNHLSSDKTFLWPGWDFIYSHDIGTLLPQLETMFFDASEVSA